MVNGACVDFVARSLVYRQAFPSHRGLVDGALAQRHDAIERNALSWTDAHYRIDNDRFDANACPTAVTLTHLGLLRCKSQQALDGAARPIHRSSLDGLCYRIQGHHHGSFGPLAYQEGARNGHRHQCVDVQAALPQCGKPFSVDGETRQGDGHSGQRHSKSSCWPTVWKSECQAFSRHGQPQCSNQFAP